MNQLFVSMCLYIICTVRHVQNYYGVDRYLSASVTDMAFLFYWGQDSGYYTSDRTLYSDRSRVSSGLYCPRNWDGWLCWEDTAAGMLISQNCPNYFKDFDPTEKATKFCGEDGLWFRHPDTNRTWSDYTRCNENTKAKLKVAPPPSPLRTCFPQV
uniref:G-protein coupled receptors family 2 profile 1 domain-containing protein n=1 Tax=Neogobius melanostomus TaxID=47308 RepID=A0A8C6TAR7_9GOBI